MAMRDGVCPRCGKKDVRRHNVADRRDLLQVSFFKTVCLTDYICGACGYIESDVQEMDLQRVRDTLPLVGAEGAAGPGQESV